MKILRMSLLTLFFVFSATCLALFFLPRSWHVYPPSTFQKLESITIVRNYDTLHGVALVLVIISFTLACASLKIKSMPFRTCLWLFPLCLYPVSCVKSVASNLAPWTYRGMVKDKTGNEYWLLNSHFLQGDRLAIGRLKQRTWFLDRFDVLVNGTGHFHGDYLYIVRPADAPDGYLQLHLTGNNWLVGLAGKNRMHLAYDLNLSQSYARGEVLSLSPFILIGDHTRLKQTDCDQLLEIGLNNETGAPGDISKMGRPRQSVVKEALNSKNPEVRALAEKLISTKKVD